MERADIPRLIGDLMQEATIASVDLAGRTARVTIGDIESGPLPWMAARVGNLTIWSPPIVGEPVFVLAPEGDLERAIIIGSLFSAAHQPGSASGSLTQLRFVDGAELAYDHDAHALTVALPAGGAITLTADAGVTVNGPLHVSRDITCDATITGSTDVVGGGKSLKSHIHKNVQAGSSLSGPPQ